MGADFLTVITRLRCGGILATAAASGAARMGQRQRPGKVWRDSILEAIIRIMYIMGNSRLTFKAKGLATTD